MPLNDGREVVDQRMKDLDLLHKENVATHPILKMSLNLARDVAAGVEKYEDLKPSLKDFELCKATHDANLVDYQKHKSKLNQII